MKYLSTILEEEHTTLLGRHFLDVSLRTQITIQLGNKAPTNDALPVVQVLSITEDSDDLLCATVLRLTPAVCYDAGYSSVNEDDIAAFLIQEYPEEVELNKKETAVDSYNARLLDVTDLVTTLASTSEQKVHDQIFRGMQRMLRLDNTMTRALAGEIPLHNLFELRGRRSWLDASLRHYSYPSWAGMFCNEPVMGKTKYGALISDTFADISSPDPKYQIAGGPAAAVFPLHTVIDRSTAQLGRAATFNTKYGKISGFLTPTFVTSLVDGGILDSYEDIHCSNHCNVFMLFGGLKKAVYDQVLGGATYDGYFN